MFVVGENLAMRNTTKLSRSMLANFGHFNVRINRLDFEAISIDVKEVYERIEEFTTRWAQNLPFS